MGEKTNAYNVLVGKNEGKGLGNWAAKSDLGPWCKKFCRTSQQGEM
jgi:hypothetical protein